MNTIESFKRRKAIGMKLALLLTATWSMPVLAQEASSIATQQSAADDESAAPGEIIVTAQKRSQSTRGSVCRSPQSAERSFRLSGSST